MHPDCDFEGLGWVLGWIITLSCTGRQDGILPKVRTTILPNQNLRSRWVWGPRVNVGLNLQLLPGSFALGKIGPE